MIDMGGVFITPRLTMVSRLEYAIHIEPPLAHMRPVAASETCSGGSFASSMAWRIAKYA